MKWISIQDELPTDTVRVLALVDNKDPLIDEAFPSPRIYEATFSRGWGWHVIGSRYSGKVLAWMTRPDDLPEPSNPST